MGDTVRKTFKYQLTPTPAQAQALEMVLSRCRTLYNVALEQHKTWWQRGQGIGATYYQQKAELPDLKAACPEYAEVNDALGTLRGSAKRVLPTDVDRKRFFDSIIATGILDLLRGGRRREAYQAIAEACRAAGVEVSEMVRQGIEEC